MKPNYLSSIIVITLAACFFSSAVNAIDVMPSNLEDLQTLNDTELNELYDYGTAYAIPGSHSPRTDWLLTGLPLPVPGYEGPSELLNFFWGGKTFTTDHFGNTSLTNQVLPTTPFTFNNVSAVVTIRDNSLTNDSAPVIFLNYKKSNVRISRPVRDELRLIAPNLYLGRAYLKNSLITRVITGQKYSFVLWFALEDRN